MSTTEDYLDQLLNKAMNPQEADSSKEIEIMEEPETGAADELPEDILPESGVLDIPEDMIFESEDDLTIPEDVLADTEEQGEDIEGMSDDLEFMMDFPGEEAEEIKEEEEGEFENQELFEDRDTEGVLTDEQQGFDEAGGPDDSQMIDESDTALQEETDFPELSDEINQEEANEDSKNDFFAIEEEGIDEFEPEPEIQTENPDIEEMGEDTQPDILQMLDIDAEEADITDLDSLLLNEEEPAVSETEASGETVGEPAVEKSEPKKLGFFAKLFGKKEQGEAEALSEDENSEILRELEEEEKEAEARAAKKKEKQEKKEQKKKEKAEKKALKAKEKIPKPPKPEAPKVKGKPLPKKPVILIFVLCISILIFVMLGTKALGYNLSINSAREHFIHQEYQQAYEDLIGLEVKEEDQKLLLQVNTIMQLYNKYNSYLNYIQMGRYEDALNSLVRGVGRYDEYIESAETLGIKNEFSNLYTLITEQLMEIFEVSEDEAREWNNIASISELTRVIQLVVREAGYSNNADEPVEELPSEETIPQE